MNQYDEHRKMEFENDEFQTTRRSAAQQTPKLTKLVINLSGGFIKTQAQANLFLLIFALVTIVISLFLLFGGGNTAGKPKDVKILPAVY